MIVESLLILLNISPKEPTNQNKDYHFVGNLINQINTKTKNLYICPNQLYTMFGPQIALKIALFLFLFLHGNGAYDGCISIHDYLNYRMNCFFLPFTLYKPYLLLIYNIHQSIMILKTISKFCFKKDIIAQNKKKPSTSECEVIETVIKYKLPKTLVGSLS